MDAFAFLVSILLLFLAMQYKEPWIVFAILVLSVFTIKSFRAIVGLVFAAFVLYFLLDYGSMQNYFPLILLGILVVGLVLGVGKGQPEQPSTGGYGDLLGGGYGGLGGLGGMGGGYE